MHVRVDGSHRDGGGEEKVTSVQLSEVGSSCHIVVTYSKKYQVPTMCRLLAGGWGCRSERDRPKVAGDASPSSGAPSSAELAGTEVKGRAPGGGKRHPMACTDGSSTAQPPCTQGQSAQATPTCPQPRLRGGFLRTTELGLCGVWGPGGCRQGRAPGRGQLRARDQRLRPHTPDSLCPSFPWVRGHLHSVSRGQVSGGQ